MVIDNQEFYALNDNQESQLLCVIYNHHVSIIIIEDHVLKSLHISLK